MIVYRKTFQEFHEDILSNRIEDEVVSCLPINVGESERRSFRNSLPAVHTALLNCDIPDGVEVALEYRIPLTNRRIDFIIAGSDEQGKDHLVICELKQWDQVRHTDMPDIVLVGNEQKVHPSWQAYSYGTTLSNFNEFVETSGIDVETCAFLHNYKRAYIDELLHPVYIEGITRSQPFISDHYREFAEFIHKNICKPSKQNVLFEIERGRIKPSKMLADCLGDLLNGNTEYQLIDEQRIVYSNLFKEIQASFKNLGQKQVFIVRGGAGTGKSVIAMQLMANLIKDKGKTAFYVAKSSYVKEAYFRKLTRGVPQHGYLRTLFKGSGAFIDSALNEYDVLIVDEAHRLTERTKQSWFFKGENQIREIIHACRTSVFFIDETQNIDIKDFGTIENIKKAAEIEGANVHCDEKYVLQSQFRCKGSDEYVAWLEAFLYNRPFEPSGEVVDYDIRVYDDLCEMRDAIVEKNSQSSCPSRMLSGDVFKWLSRDDPEALDIVIGDFKAQWNRSESFATNPKSIDEVGCIHTSQGMEFEYVGLIVGDDLLYRDGKIVTDYTKHPEKAGEFRRPHQKKVLPEDYETVDRIIRNTYKVLFTRGMKGCFLYVMDKNLKNYLTDSLRILKNNGEI